MYEEVLMRKVIDYVVKKLRAVSKNPTNAVLYFDILSALCTCKGVPVKQNQCKLELLHYMAVAKGPVGQVLAGLTSSNFQ